jgi:hypothetical protein
MKIILILIILFSISCSSEGQVKENKSGDLGFECKENFICNGDLACKDNMCISKEEACKYITCSGDDGSSHGDCIVKDSKVTCECDEDAYLESNTKCILLESCNKNFCSNRGICESLNNQITCSCEDGFEGEHCEINVDDCIGNPCLDHGECLDGVNTYTCKCYDGYDNFGKDCLKVELQEVDLGSNYDEGDSIVLDSNQNIYVLGEVANTELDSILIKFNPELEKLWDVVWENSYINFISSKLLAINSLDNIYVSGDKRDVYDSDGNFLKTYSGGSGSIVIDHDDNIISLGEKLKKVSIDNDEIWSVEDIPSNSRMLSIDSNNNIYVLDEDIGGHNKLNLVKLNSAGEKQWDKLFGTDKQEFVKDIFISKDDSVYLSGTTSGSFPGYENKGGMSDTFVMKVSSDGELIWVIQYGSSGQDTINSIAEDSEGGIYVAGDTSGRITEGVELKGRNLFLSKISVNGEVEWIREWFFSDFNNANSIIINNEDILYITGSTGNIVTNTVMIAKNLILLKIELK